MSQNRTRKGRREKQKKKEVRKKNNTSVQKTTYQTHQVGMGEIILRAGSEAIPTGESMLFKE